MRYQDVVHKKQSLLALTSLTPDEFVALVPAFKACFLDTMRQTMINGVHRSNRCHVTYKNSPLPTIEDKLLFILVHMKQNPTQELQGRLFEMSQSVANKWLQILRPVLPQALQDVSVCRHAQQRLRVIQIVYPLMNPPFFYHDGSERPVQRPIDGDEQEEYYSGKKRCHTVKNILLIRETCDVAYLSPTPAGKWHEKSIAADEQYRLPANSVLYQDMGFQVSRLLALSVGDTRPPGLT